jgi:hypothetical protein
MLPFTPEQFLGVLVNYNHAIWPIQIAAYALGALSIASLFRRTRAADRVITGVLAAMWLWTGVELTTKTIICESRQAPQLQVRSWGLGLQRNRRLWGTDGSPVIP